MSSIRLGSPRNAKSSFSGVAITISRERNASSSPAERPLAPYSDETLNPSGANVLRKDRSVWAESARNGVTIRTRYARESVIRAAISATRVLPALVGSATTRSSLTSADRRAASRCDGHNSTSDVLRA